jgi:hypothetical protein
MRRVLAGPALIVALASVFTLRGSSQTFPVALVPGAAAPQVMCGTTVDEGLRGMRPQAVVPAADGELLSFVQDPPLLYPDYAGAVTLRRFQVVGDVPTLTFRRYNADNPDGDAEVWTRARTEAIGGRLISVFEPSWDAKFLDKLLTRTRIGYDYPAIYLGFFTISGARRPVMLRLGFNGLPHSDVAVIDASAQYASNVLNIVVPGFGDDRVNSGLKGFELPAATQQALRYIADTYDDIAFVPVPIPVADYGAFHRNVRNAVSGINIASFDYSTSYGSDHRLQGVELFGSMTAARYEDTDHEISHQWNSNFDWARIAGITTAGHEPSAHSPLWTQGESLVGAVLLPSRRVRAKDAGFAIEATPAPARFHPLELYAMGVLPPERVPDFLVFQNQAQFSLTGSMAPAVDTPVTGEARTYGVRDVIREHGARVGPAPTVWRRATVVVSTERLLSQREMDYWNFFVQRLADRTGAGTPTFEGYAPFRTATGNAVRLVTAIDPIGRPALAENLDTDAPAFGARDWRGIELTQPLPGRVAAGTTIRVAGRVTAPDAVDFNQVGVIFFQSGSSDTVKFYGTVSTSRDFGVDVKFADTQRGRYAMGIYLYWPNSGAQYPRTALSTFVVQ